MIFKNFTRIRKKPLLSRPICLFYPSVQYFDLISTVNTLGVRFQDWIFCICCILVPVCSRIYLGFSNVIWKILLNWERTFCVWICCVLFFNLIFHFYVCFNCIASIEFAVCSCDIRVLFWSGPSFAVLVVPRSILEGVSGSSALILRWVISFASSCFSIPCWWVVKLMSLLVL